VHVRNVYLGPLGIDRLERLSVRIFGHITLTPHVQTLSLFGRRSDSSTDNRKRLMHRSSAAFRRSRRSSPLPILFEFDVEAVTNTTSNLRKSWTEAISARASRGLSLGHESH
jgi:hypothetical protein